MASDTLSSAVLNQQDPVLVERGLPAYLLLLDGLIDQSPENEDLLAAGAQLYALYGSRFEPEPERRAGVTAQAREYGRRAMCQAHARACEWEDLGYDEFVAELERVGARDVDYLFSYSVGWLSHLDATRLERRGRSAVGGRGHAARGSTRITSRVRSTPISGF